MPGVFFFVEVLAAQIGTDHMEVTAHPQFFYFTLQIHERVDSSDYTGAVFTPSNDGETLQWSGSLADQGVTVFKVKPGDALTEENIQAGMFDRVRQGTLDLNQPVYLGFRTPVLGYRSPVPGPVTPAYGWAKLTYSPAAYVLNENGQPMLAPGGGIAFTGGLQLLDHAMEYGGEGIVVGEKQSNSHEGMIPVSQFGQAESLVPMETEIARWNVGDFDGDGGLDLVVPNSDGAFQIWKQLENHSFETLVGGRIPSQGRPDGVGDVDGDGDMDILFSRYHFIQDDITSEIWLNQGDGSFLQSDVDLPESLSSLFGDLDNDGDLDVVLVVPTGHFSKEIQNWRNNGQGGFSKASSISLSCFSTTVPAFLGDLNGDGFIDLFFGCEGLSRVGLNRGDGDFALQKETYANSNILTMEVGSTLAGGDVDGDGDLDVVVPNVNFPSALWLNDGDGRFHEGQTDLKMGRNHALLGDIDTDGDLDLLLQAGSDFSANGDADGLHIYWNEGPDQFFKGPVLKGGDRFTLPRLLDMDQDGDLDILVRYRNALVAYYNSIEFVTPPPSEEGIQIPDSGLKRRIQETLKKKPSESITEEDMLRLTWLDLSIRTRGTSAPPISDFTGLERASNLTVLDLSGAMDFDFLTGVEKLLPAVTGNDLSFLSSLKNLTTLNLAVNGFTALELPENLAQLKELDVSDNAISELNLPGSLTGLKELRIQYNRILRLSLPEEMTQLETVWAEANGLSEIIIPPSLIHLKRLYLGSNQIQSLVLPQLASKLEWLSLSGNVLKELSFPDHPQRLFWLNLGESAKGLENYDFLIPLTGLKHLEIKDSRFDPNALSAPLAGLETLRLDAETAIQFSLNEGYASLKELNLTGSRLERVHLPSDLGKLQTIFLSSERITEMSFPEGLTGLRQISFNGRRLQKVSLSSDMVNLGVLDISRTQVKALKLPDGVGSQSPLQHSVFAYETPLQSFKAPDRWANSIRSNRAFIRADVLQFSESRGLEMRVFAEFGTIIIEKSSDLKDWTTVETVQITGPGSSYRFRDPDATSQGEGFYRVRLTQ